MTKGRRVRALAAAAIVLAVVAACSKDPSAPPKEPSATSAAPTATSKNEIAAKDATKLLRSYYAVRDELRQKPNTALSKLTSVAISTELAAQQKLFQTERKKGHHQMGGTNIADLTVQSVNLDNSDPQGGRVPTVEIDICYDVSDVDILDKDGRSVVTTERPDTGWIRYSVSNYQWAKDPSGGWRVASSENLERTPCDAS